MVKHCCCLSNRARDSVAEQITHININFFFLGFFLLDLGLLLLNGSGGGGTTGGHGGELFFAFSDHLGDGLASELGHHGLEGGLVGGNTAILKELGNVVLS